MFMLSDFVIFMLIIVIMYLINYLAIFITALSPEELKTAKKWFKYLIIVILLIFSIYFIYILPLNNLFTSIFLIIFLTSFLLILNHFKKDIFLSSFLFILFMCSYYFIKFDVVLISILLIYFYLKSSLFVCDFYNKKDHYSLDKPLYLIMNLYYEKTKVLFWSELLFSVFFFLLMFYF